MKEMIIIHCPSKEINYFYVKSLKQDSNVSCDQDGLRPPLASLFKGEKIFCMLSRSFYGIWLAD